MHLYLLRIAAESALTEAFPVEQTIPFDLQLAASGQEPIEPEEVTQSTPNMDDIH